MSFRYPTSVSRTLSPSKHSLRTVVALHDKQLADADYNLTQDIQDQKREELLAATTCSGALTYSPFQFSSNSSLRLTIPSFEVLFRGSVVNISGNLSSDLTKNIVTLPSPPYWTPGSSNKEFVLYTVFLELWLARLDPNSGTGFYTDPVSGSRYIYCEGCVNSYQANLISDDTIDPFDGRETTERVQTQWALRVQPIASTYDFTKYRLGLDPGATLAETVWGQGPQSQPQSTSPYQFTNMTSINGDSGLWRSGDGNSNNALATLDGYSYAMPVAVIMQRNTGAYSIVSNPLGCANPLIPASGTLLTGVSGRFDGKYADVVYASDVVDTRSIVSLTGYDYEKLLGQGFNDLVSGQTKMALARGITPGGIAGTIGSRLNYQVSVSSGTYANTDNVGTFDGIMNGFRVDAATFSTTKVVTVNDKISGVIGGRWTQGDVITFSLPASSKAVISSVQVQGLVSNTATSSKTPATLLPGQITIGGTGTSTVSISFAKNLSGTAFDPGTNPIYLTLDVTYPVNSGMDLRHVPSRVYGGTLYDSESGKTLPVYGVSAYEVQASQPTTSAMAVWAINPQYSNLVFGLRAWIPIAGSTGVSSTDGSGNVTTTFTLSRSSLNGSLTGIYAVKAWDSITNKLYTITSRSIQGSNIVVVLQGAVSTLSTVIFSFLCSDTAQAAYNPAVKGITSIEETVLCGTVTGNSNFHMDDRISVVSVTNTSGVSNTVVLAVSDALLKGIAGDDSVKLIWVEDSDGYYDAVQIGSTQFSNGMVTLVVPPTVNLSVQSFFLVASICPSFASTSSLLLTEDYIPYQGEGVASVDYDLVFAPDTAFISTNGTGAAPVPGISDVFPYNRSIPITTLLPSRAGWTDSSLANTAVQSLLASNYEAKVFDDIENTFEVPLYTNDFIPPIQGDTRKSIRFVTGSGNRGFSSATPHVGFAISPVTNENANDSSLPSTTGPITIFVDNINGKDTNSGLSLNEPLATIGTAVASLPPVLRHPCTIVIVPNNSSPISLASPTTTLQSIPLGDGVVRSKNYYALANLAFSVQDSGSLTFVSSLSSSNVVIDATGFAGFGEGPTSAFFVNNSRVIFNGITFNGFNSAAVKGIAADVEFVNCLFTNNLTSGSFEDASTVILQGCTISLGSGATGIILSQSSLDVNATDTSVVTGASPNAFWVVEYSSTLALGVNSPGNETNVTSSTLITEASLNSTVVCSPSYTSQGAANISNNSIISRTVGVTPFAGGITVDASSNVTTEL